MKITIRARNGKMNRVIAAPMPEVARVDADVVGIGPEDVRGVVGPALGQEPHRREVGEGEHHRVEQADQQDRPHDRDHHVVEPPQRARAVDLGRLDDFLGHRGEPGQQDDRGEREAAPDVHDDHRPHGQARLAQPLPGIVDDVGVHQHPVDDAVERVEHPLPRQRGQRDRDDERDQDDSLHQALALERPVQREGERQPDHEPDQLGAEREHEGVAHRLPEDRVGEQARVVLHAHEVAVGRADARARDRQVDRHEERVGDEEGEVEEGGGDPEEALEGLAVGPSSGGRHPHRGDRPRPGADQLLAAVAHRPGSDHRSHAADAVRLIPCVTIPSPFERDGPLRKRAVSSARLSGYTTALEECQLRGPRFSGRVAR